MLVVLMVLAAGCGRAAGTETLPVTVDAGVPHGAGLAVDVHHPEGTGPWPIVVLVPGGSWRSADLESTAALATHIASQGAVVYNATYRLTAPQAYEDVACALAVARETGPDYEGDADRMVAAGVSAGAHVTAVAVLSRATCRGEEVASPTAFVGVAGPYDVAAFAFVPDLRRFLGGPPEAEPGRWAEADPYRYLDEPPALRFGLVHGEADIVAPPQQSRDLAAALAAAGAETSAVFLDGIGHRGITAPGPGGDAVAALVLDLAG